MCMNLKDPLRSTHDLKSGFTGDLVGIGDFNKAWSNTNWQDRFGGQFDDAWGGGNWMDRVGLGELKDGGGGGNNTTPEDPTKTIPEPKINPLASAGGSRYGGSKAAKFKSNRGPMVGRKALVIQKPRSN